MTAALLGLAWLAVGGAVAFRGARAPVERALALLFWLFFLGDRPADPEPAALARLRRALGEGDAAQDVVAALRGALDRLSARRARVAEELGALGEGDGVDGARARSRALLREAIAAVDRERARLEAAVEETATRLVLAREGGAPEQVDALLDALRSRLSAAEEVDRGVSPAG